MFLDCVYDSCSVTKECPHLLSYVCCPRCDSTAAHLTRIIAEIVKLLKDSSDSGVGNVCRDMVGLLSGIYLTGKEDSTVDLFVKPLFEAMGEQNKLVQSRAATCMARVVDSAATPPITSFQKLCPRICKLLSNSTFLAKPSLLPVVSSLAQVGAIAPQSLEPLLESIHDCLASTDWVTRKAAAETLTALASHSSGLIKDKTDSTITLLDNCRFDKIKPVRESVTEALQLWKNISRKCVDSALEISSGEQLGSEAARNHAATSHTDDQSEGSAIQRQLLQLEGRQTSFTNMFQNFMCASHNRMLTLERIAEDMGKDLSILSGRSGNLTAGFGKYKSFVNFPTGKYNGRAPGDRDSQTDGAMRGRMCNHIPPHAASRNGQAGARSPRSEQHENEHVGNGRIGCDNKASETSRFGGGPSASENEATLGAGRVAGKDVAVTRPTPIAAVPEAEAMGDEENKGQERDLISTSYKKAMLSFRAGDVDSAYAEVFGLGDKRLILYLMAKTGPSIRHMSSTIANKALNFICEFLEDDNLYGICVSWIQQLVEVLLLCGSETFGVPMERKEDFLYTLLDASQTMDQPEQLVMQLASAWDFVLFT